VKDDIRRDVPPAGFRRSPLAQAFQELRIRCHGAIGVGVRGGPPTAPSPWRGGNLRHRQDRADLSHCDSPTFRREREDERSRPAALDALTLYQIGVSQNSKEGLDPLEPQAGQSSERRDSMESPAGDGIGLTAGEHLRHTLDAEPPRQPTDA
jgi:hypothetical protein